MTEMKGAHGVGIGSSGQSGLLFDQSGNEMSTVYARAGKGINLIDKPVKETKGDEPAMADQPKRVEFSESLILSSPIRGFILSSSMKPGHAWEVPSGTGYSYIFSKEDWDSFTSKISTYKSFNEETLFEHPTLGPMLAMMDV